VSKAKLAAVKALIQEKHYEVARQVLQTMDGDPTAHRWLQKLDQIAPPVAVPDVRLQQEQIEFYRAENRKRRRRFFWNGWKLLGIAALSFLVFFGHFRGTFTGWDVFSLGLGIFTLLSGLYSIKIGVRGKRGIPRV
jgi:hypothetical protein